MAHEIDVETGVASVYSGRGVTPWHGLGDVRPGLYTAGELAARPEWAIPLTMLPVRVRLADGRESVSSDVYASVRTDTGLILGTGSARYYQAENLQTLQGLGRIVGEEWSDEAGAFTRVADDTGYAIETAGSLDAGRAAWVLFARRDGAGISIDGPDTVRPYVLATWRHDGRGSLRVIGATVRVVCANTLALASQDGAVAVAEITHTPSLPARLRATADAMAMLAGAIPHTTARMRALAGAPARDELVARVSALVADSLCPSSDDRGHAVDVFGAVRRSRRELIAATRETIVRAITEGVADPFNGRPGTAWALLNSVTGLVDHGAGTVLPGYRAPRECANPERTRAEHRLVDLTDGRGGALKSRVFDVLASAN